MNYLKLFLASLGLVCTLSYSYNVDAEEIEFSHVTNLGVQIADMIQDEDGFFWIATSHGLKRYDGIEFKTWRKSEDGLSEDFIRAIDESNNAIWALTNSKGLNRYEKNTGVFTQYLHDPENENSFKGTGGFALLVDPKGLVWVGSEIGVLNRLDPKTGQFKHYSPDVADPNSMYKGLINSIIMDSSGILWIGSDGGGLFRFDPETEQITRFVHDPGDPSSLSENRVREILEEDQDTLWVGTGEGGLNRFDKKSRTFKRYQHDKEDKSSISSNAVVFLGHDINDHLWVGTIHGALNRFNKKTGKFTRYLSDPKNPKSTLTKTIEKVHIDHSENIWVFARSGEIQKSDRKKRGFNLYQHDPKNPSSLSSNIVFPVYEDKEGTIWIGTGSGGLNKLDRESNTFQIFKPSPKDPHSIPNLGVFALAEDRQGRFWVSSGNVSEGALSIMDRKSGKFIIHYRHDPKNPKSISQHRFLLDILPDHNDPDILWLTIAFGGLEKFNTRLEEFTHYPSQPTLPDKLAGNYMVAYQDEEGFLWLGGNNGLDRFNPETEAVKRYRYQPDNPNSLIENQVLAIYEDEAGVFWLATSGGLERFDRKTEIFTHITNTQGLPDNNVLGVFKDKMGIFWLSTASGIVKYNPENQTFRKYTKADGLQGNAFYYFSDMQTSDGEIWFGGFGGVNSFYPDQIKDNPYLPNIVLTSVKQGGEEVFFGKPPSRLKKIHLDWQNNFFEFEVAALEFTNPKNNQFKYILEGFDKEWYRSGTRRFGRYTNLPAGSYNLRILGSNNDGIWNEKGTSLMVIVDPPYWKTWWAYLLYFLSGLLLVLAFLKYQRDKLERQRKIAEQERNTARILKKAEEKYRGIFENSMAGIYHVSLKGELIIANPAMATLLGFVSPEELIDSTENVFESLFANQEQRNQLQKQIDQKEEIRNFEFVCYKKDKSVFTASTNVHTVLNDDGTPLFYEGILEDVTEKKEIENLKIAKETAEKANAAKSDFLASMSHELRTPLNSIIGFSSIIGRKGNLDTSQQNHLKIIRRSGDHLLTLINDVLEMSKIEAGHSVLNESSFDLLWLLRNVKDMMQLKASEKGLRFLFEYTSDVPRYIQTDEAKLRQILINVIGNAIKFTHEGGIAVRVKPKQNEAKPGNKELENISLLFEIEDTGEGIAKQEMDRLFEPFIQTGSGHRSKKGTGLGLTISRNFARLMGGDIKVQSTLNKGSIFKISIIVKPAIIEDIQIVEKTIKKITLAPDQPQFKILIVEDMEENIMLMESLLQQAGLQTEVAINGKLGLEKYQSYNPDLIFMDIRMPVMDGFEATRRIREIEKEKLEVSHKPIPIIAVSASTFKEDRARILSRGCNDFIRKPYLDSELYAALEKHLKVVFEIEIEKQESDTLPFDDPNLTHESLASLPLEVLKELKQAILTLDQTKIETIVDQIKEIDEPIANSIHGYAKDFKYDHLNNLLKEVQKEKQILL